MTGRAGAGRTENGGPRRAEAGDRREFGRDGITGLVEGDRALRAREVSRPTTADLAAAELVVDDLVARARGRRRQ
ncbi:hypothetical protein ACQB6R_09985 [Propionibacteriaceae bacterium G1746]|uniref:hypothetical protein n=1 Tax=Aestuariimicrobium sp. G57 TaxID=3418485 RepID=UPI003C28B30E